MDLSYSSDERDLIDLARQVFATFDQDILAESPPREVVPRADRFMGEVAGTGLLGIGLDEEVGGSGGTLVDLGIVFREAGRAVVPTAIRSTIGAALHIDQLGTTPQREEWLGRLTTGEVTAALAIAEPGVDRRIDLITTTASASADGWVLGGTKTLVENISTAGVFVVAALVAGEGAPTVKYFVVPAEAPGLSIETTTVIGEEDHGRLTLADVPVPASGLLGEDPRRDSRAAAARAMLVFDALRAQEMVGIAEQIVERTAEYVTTRHQFGRPIGTFQAVQHRVADMLIATRAAGHLANRAVWTLSEGLDAERDVAASVVLAAKAAEIATLSAHQVHAGMGYAKESKLYLWSQRAKSLVLQTSGRRHQLQRVAESLFDAA